MFFKLAYKSILNRKGSVILTVMAMTLSIFVLLGVEHIRHEAKNSFGNTVSGVDLIVGARTSQINLLLYSVFRIGTPTNNIEWDSYQKLSRHPSVEWAIPLSLGDSHKGYRVVGTSSEYFSLFRYGHQQSLQFKKGKPFQGRNQVVLGAEVARELGYAPGDDIILAHGIGSTSFSLHENMPFQVSGILKPTATPVDHALYVSLEGIEAIHMDPNQIPDESQVLTPKAITAFMLGLVSRMATFKVQRDINTYQGEPLSAILPGVALSEMWQMIGQVENILRFISILVLASSLLGMSAMLLTSIRDRQNEIKLLRSIGASPGFLFLLIELEALLMLIVSVVIAVFVLTMGLYGMNSFIAASSGIFVSTAIFYTSNIVMLGVIIVSGVVLCAIPAYVAFMRASLTR